MNPTILTYLITAAYLTVAALAWRPIARRICIDTRQESLEWSWSREEWNPARARRTAGLIAVLFAVLWPVSLLSFGLTMVVPPVYRRIMDKATAGIGDDDRDTRATAESGQDPARAFDDLEPVDAVVMAWTMHEGSAYRHDVKRKAVEEAMPALARALDRLTKQSTDTST